MPNYSEIDRTERWRRRRRRGRIEALDKKLKIVIVVVIGVVVVLFLGVTIVLSFVAPGTVLEADSNNNITGVTQFLC